MTQNWIATVTVHRWKTPPTDEQLAELVAALPGFGIVADDGERRVTVHMSFPAKTARSACDEAVRAARAGWSQALSATPEVTAVRVVTEDDWQAEAARPSVQDLIGKSEAAALLKVSPQRVDELSHTHVDFPAPVANPKMGPIYTRGSIEAFDKGWARQRTGRPKKTAPPA